jgi:hypothetical protein
LLRFGPSSCPYSPKCLLGTFSEVRMFRLPTTKSGESRNGQAKKEKETVRYEVHPERAALLLCRCLVTSPLLLTKPFFEYICVLIENSSHYPYILGHSLQFSFSQVASLNVTFQRREAFLQVLCVSVEQDYGISCPMITPRLLPPKESSQKRFCITTSGCSSQ